jgi:hypothetical protein
VASPNPTAIAERVPIRTARVMTGVMRIMAAAAGKVRDKVKALMPQARSDLVGRSAGVTAGGQPCWMRRSPRAGSACGSTGLPAGPTTASWFLLNDAVVALLCLRHGLAARRYPRRAGAPSLQG